MKAHTASLINAVILIGFGLWAYLEPKSAGEVASKTALIPVGFGVVLLSLYKGVEKENKIVAHIAVLLTLLILIALGVKPLPAALSREDGMAVMRVAVMMLTSALSMFFFIKSFRDVRRARAAKAAEQA